MTSFLQQILNGLVLGGVYATVALGYTMVYGILGLINFAHGEVVMVGALVSLSVVELLTKAKPRGPGAGGGLIALLAAISVCMGLDSLSNASRTGHCAVRHAWPHSSRPSASRYCCKPSPC
jgi:branched-chain amino acid transport system permease protein